MKQGERERERGRKGGREEGREREREGEREREYVIVAKLGRKSEKINFRHYTCLIISLKLESYEIDAYNFCW